METEEVNKRRKKAFKEDEDLHEFNNRCNLIHTKEKIYGSNLLHS